MTAVLAIIPLFLSLTIVIFAGLQWRISSNRLRLDLFDRRYKVYDTAKKFLSLTIREAKFESDLIAFNIGVADAEFLFESDVLQYLKGLRKNALHLSTTQALLSRPQTDHALKKAQKRRKKILNVLQTNLRS
jgi:hypothetical protein